MVTDDLRASGLVTVLGGQFQLRVCDTEKRTGRACSGPLGERCLELRAVERKLGGRRPRSASEGLVCQRREEAPFPETTEGRENENGQRTGRDKCTSEGPYRRSKHLKAVNQATNG